MLNKIIQRLGSPKKFRTSNRPRKAEIALGLRKLTTLLKYQSLFEYDKTIELEQEREIFHTRLKAELLKPIDRVNSAKMNNQLKMSIEFIIDKLKNINKNIKINKNIDSINKRFVEGDVFNDLLLHTMLSSISYIPDSENDLDINENEVIYSYFVREVTKKLYLYLTMTILKNPKSNDNILESFHDELELLTRNLEIDFFERLAYQLVEIFIYSLGCKVRNVLILKSKKKKNQNLEN